MPFVPSQCEIKGGKLRRIAGACRGKLFLRDSEKAGGSYSFEAVKKQETETQKQFSQVK
jgi:hypothetical protein